ncbi:CLIP domain-containing serine protease 2-like, partial [Contarinia nasturtii]|uniref:CLIP domain-containing serine protease 2-like n=1 Tax=Contarinia nasturtii TaxID=265458 RepID=UPI0012D45FF6
MPNVYKSYRCGGVLINDNDVLTASHCVNAELSGVRLGEWNLREHMDCEENVYSGPVQDICVVERIRHEDYHPNSMVNDIALLRLERPAPYTSWIQPICLPTSSDGPKENVNGFPYQVSGWARTGWEVPGSAGSSIKLR